MKKPINIGALSQENWLYMAENGGQFYQVSNLGRIRSLFFKNTAATFPRTRILTPRVGNTGYLQVHIHDNGVSKLLTVHREVAKAFIPNPENSPQVNHMDANKLNNHAQNLEWVTARENIAHARGLGLMPGPKSANAHTAILTNASVKRMRLVREISPDMPQWKIGRMFGVSQSNVSYILSRHTWTRT